MSNCANIINRLFSEVCFLKEREAKTYLMLDILQINQAIYQHLDTTVYIVPETPSTIYVCGIPVTVQQGSSTYKALVVLDKNQRGIGTDCIVYSTKNLEGYGDRTGTGFFDFTKTVPIDVIKVDISILNKVDQAQVISALRNCADTKSTSTLTCQAYDALSTFLYKYGVRNISVYQAACIYQQLASKSVETSGLSPLALSAEVESSAVESGNSSGDAVAVPSADGVVESNHPFEPHAPYEPSDIVSNVYVRQLQDSSISESFSNNDSIELKLKALLEATETSEQTE